MHRPLLDYPRFLIPITRYAVHLLLERGHRGRAPDRVMDASAMEDVEWGPTDVDKAHIEAMGRARTQLMC